MWEFRNWHTQLMFSPQILSHLHSVVSFIMITFCFFCSTDITLPSFFNHHPSPPSVLPVAQHSVLLSALCGGSACVNMTDWAPVGTLIASFHGCESVLWSGRVNKLWIQEQEREKEKDGERGSDGMKIAWKEERKGVSIKTTRGSASGWEIGVNNWGIEINWRSVKCEIVEVWRRGKKIS